MANFLTDYGKGLYTVTFRTKDGKTHTHRGKSSGEAERMRRVLSNRKRKGDVMSVIIKREK